MHANNDSGDSTLKKVSFEEFAPPAKEAWRSEAEAALKGAPFDKKMYTKTYEGITLEPIYDLESARPYLSEDDLPGAAPFLRGCCASGYMAKPWGIAQACSSVIPEEAAAIALHEIKKGATAVRFDLDECTRRSLDPDAVLFKGDYRGLSLSNIKDADQAFGNIDASTYPLFIYAGASALPLLALMAAQARASGKLAAFAETKGAIGADPLGELAAGGELPLPLDELYDEMATALKWCAGNAPKIKTIYVRGEPYHNGGSNAVQETAYAISAAVAYVRAMARRGIAPEVTASQIKFSFSIGANFFMEIARLRAARMIWCQALEAFDVSGEALKMDVIASTSGFTPTVYDPYVNILRATTQSFAGVVGGVSDFTVGCFDEAVRPPLEISRRIARNIQIMLQTEFNLTEPVDPAGGSWYIETLAEQIAAETWKVVQDVEARGGLFTALEEGDVQKNIGDVLAKRFKNLAMRSDRSVGTNMYANITETPLPVETPSAAELFSKRSASIEKYREIIDDKQREESLQKISSSGDEELFESVVATFMAGASIGEVRRVLNDGFEGKVSVEPLGSHRWTEQFEALRSRTEAYMAKSGDNVKVFLVNMGPIPQHKGRADFSTGFMEVAHFEVLKNNGFAKVEEAVSAALESRADVAIICSTDDTYPELVPPIARGIKAKRPDMFVILAGAPAAEHKDSYVEAGVDEFIHVRANCYEVLKHIQDLKEGM